MKKYNLLVLMAAAVLAAGCFGKDASSTVTPTAPNGTFKGQFTRLHKKPNTSVYDTIKTTVTLNISSNGYTYAITGDTTLHAGSKGTYAYDGTYIQFNDNTFTPKNNFMPTKPHLYGVYQYGYDGTIFQMLRTQSDTLLYKYDLTRTQ